MNRVLSISRRFQWQAAVLQAVLVIALLHHADLAMGDSVVLPEDSGETGQLPSEGPAIETLTPQVQVQRAGRILTLDFQLVDAQGRRHPPSRERRGTPPTFTVYKDGQPIGTGSFEYG